jgi:hypothetical protein
MPKVLPSELLRTHETRRGVTIIDHCYIRREYLFASNAIRQEHGPAYDRGSDELQQHTKAYMLSIQDNSISPKRIPHATRKY